MSDGPSRPPKQRRRAPPVRPTPTSAGGWTALTPEIRDAICDAVEGGAPLKYAAMAAGISQAALHEWEARGSAGEQPFEEFVQHIARARAKGIVSAVTGVKSGVMMNGASDWKAFREWLSMVAPDEFAPTSTIEVKMRGQAQDDLLTRLREGLDPATYARVLEVLMGGSGEAGEAESIERRDH